MNLKSLAAALPLALAVSAVPGLLAAPAHADDGVCNGRIGAVQIDDNVVVPRGATCTLRGTRIDGNVIVRGNASLYALGVRVNGNVQAENHRRRGPAAPGGRGRAPLPGRRQHPARAGRRGVVNRNRVIGDVQLFGNDGRFTVRGNDIDGNLQCGSNSPHPVGGGNRVDGNKEGQCRHL